MSIFSGDIGVDLGTANTLIYIEKKGIVVNEPSVVAIDTTTRKILAVGNEAKEMVGRTPNEITAIRPLKDGVIADFEITEEMLRLFLRKVHKYRWLIRPRIVICIPSGITEVEKRAVKDAAEHAGAREVYLVSEPMAASIGVGLPVEEPTGSMIIDIGGGTTEIAVIALGGIVNNTSIRVGGDEMDDAIIQYMKKTYNLLIGQRTAEQIKFRIGSAYHTDEQQEMEVKGRDLIAGIPKTISITSSETREALAEPINDIVDAVKLALEKTPPELSADILDRGIIMTGGGALLKGLDERLRQETNLPINVVEDPLTCVVRGTGKIISDFSYWSKILIKHLEH